MTTTSISPTVTLGEPGPAAYGDRSELLKIRTTNTWWIFLLSSLSTTALALLLSMVQARCPAGRSEGMRAEDAATFACSRT
jgi:hypothetical protein